MNFQTINNKCSSFADMAAHCCVVSMNNCVSCISDVLRVSNEKRWTSQTFSALDAIYFIFMITTSNRRLWLLFLRSQQASRVVNHIKSEFVVCLLFHEIALIQSNCDSARTWQCLRKSPFHLDDRSRQSTANSASYTCWRYFAWKKTTCCKEERLYSGHVVRRNGKLRKVMQRKRHIYDVLEGRK